MAYLRAYILLLLTSIIYCCSPKCQYDEGLKLYFKRILHIDLSQELGEKYFYIVPLESCESCIYDNLKFLSGVKSTKLTVVFVGKNPNTSWVKMITTIRENLHTLDDPRKVIYNYETGLRKPLLILVQSGNCVSSETVNESEIINVFSSLNLGD